MPGDWHYLATGKDYGTPWKHNQRQSGSILEQLTSYELILSPALYFFGYPRFEIASLLDYPQDNALKEAWLVM